MCICEILQVHQNIFYMNHFISLEEAITMTARYRQNRLAILGSTYQTGDILALSETFEREAIDVLLAKTGCTRLRIYYGMDENLKVHAVLVAADANNADILPVTNMLNEEEDESIAERGLRCPDVCPEPSDLNN